MYLIDDYKGNDFLQIVCHFITLTSFTFCKYQHKRKLPQHSIPCQHVLIDIPRLITK